ncbi:hypothetical protein EVAR_70565_1 [Eumeta japonica]|uniref:Uncharacterized protein n=1 Tax=Eumeta variegata TaxID=151549 RepID=A0A4C1SUX0_EUMVA|nr:hypothetical protein EVAR_70565_1 [Eumeta japonica]
MWPYVRNGAAVTAFTVRGINFIVKKFHHRRNWLHHPLVTRTQSIIRTACMQNFGSILFTIEESLRRKNDYIVL